MLKNEIDKKKKKTNEKETFTKLIKTHHQP
jgi:hypothetical protein